VARVARLPFLTEDIGALGVRRGTKLSQALGRVINELMGDDELPAPGDVFTLLPPRVALGAQIAAHGRQVPGHGLWVWYRATPDEVEIVALTRTL
jgi:hypothetical protein